MLPIIVLVMFRLGGLPVSVLKVGSYFNNRVLSFKFFFEARETNFKGDQWDLNLAGKWSQQFNGLDM